MVELEIPDSWISNVLKAGGVLIVLVMVGTLIRPSITGDVTNRLGLLDADLQTCYYELNQTTARLEASEDVIDSLSKDVSNLTHQYYDCAAELSEFNMSMSNITEDYELLESELELLEDFHKNLTEDYYDLEDDFLSFADNMARDACCGRSPDVDYGSYDINDYSIDCRTEDNGEYELAC